MAIVEVIVEPASDKGSSYRNISFLGQDARPFDVACFPLEVLKDIVEWAYSCETTTVAQQAVREFAAELGMTETGKSEGRMYGPRQNWNSIRKDGSDYPPDTTFICQQCRKPYRLGDAKASPLAFCSNECGKAFYAAGGVLSVVAEIPLGKTETCTLTSMFPEQADKAVAAMAEEFEKVKAANPNALVIHDSIVIDVPAD